MAEYNAADTKQVRAAKRAATAADNQRKGVVLNLMSSSAGRSWVYDWLLRCHCFRSPFTGIAANTDFNCGEQNIGLQLLGEINLVAPDQYIMMMREASDREQANGRSSGSDSSGPGGDREDTGGGDSGSDGEAGSVESDYEPGLDGEA